MTGRVRVTGPADLIEVVPYLLGFAPAESTVVIGLTGNQVTVTARVDLAAGESAASDVVRQLLAQTERAVTIVYTEQPAPQWIRQPAHLLSEALLVTGGRWYSLLCTDSTCCPTDGQPLRTTPSAVSATAVSLGIAPAHTRQEITDNLAPSEVTDQATGAADTLTPIPARDRAWLALDELAGDYDALASKAEEYLHIARHCPQDQRSAAPWFLYAWAQWRLGDGARAMIALDNLDAATPNTPPQTCCGARPRQPSTRAPPPACPHCTATSCVRQSRPPWTPRTCPGPVTRTATPSPGAASRSTTPPADPRCGRSRPRPRPTPTVSPSPWPPCRSRPGAARHDRHPRPQHPLERRQRRHRRQDSPAHRVAITAAAARMHWSDQPYRIRQLQQPTVRVLTAAIFFGRLDQLHAAAAEPVQINGQDRTLIGLADDRNRYYLLELGDVAVYVLHQSRDA